jgi:hypothetical protein
MSTQKVFLPRVQTTHACFGLNAHQNHLLNAAERQLYRELEAARWLTTRHACIDHSDYTTTIYRSTTIIYTKLVVQTVTQNLVLQMTHETLGLITRENNNNNDVFSN